MENIFQCFKMAWVFSCKFFKKICIFSEHLFLKIPQDDCFWKLSKLTKVSVYAKPIERQWVSTSLQVSCDETLSTFKVHPDLENNDATVKCIAKFIEFWKTVNIHTAYADIHWRDLKRTVIRNPNDNNLQKPIDMSNFAKEMTNKSGRSVRCLTKDTGNCLSQTCNGLVELSINFLDTTHKYVTVEICQD